jgi:hypothetical protein
MRAGTVTTASAVVCDGLTYRFGDHVGRRVGRTAAGREAQRGVPGGRPPGLAQRKDGGGAAAQPDADGGTACLASIARTGAPRGAAPPHSVTIQACVYMYKS